MRGRRRRHHRTLFWRVYLQGVLLLVVVSVAVGLTVSALGGRPGPHMEMPRRIGDLLAQDLAGLEGPALQARLNTLAETFDADLVVYDSNGGVRAAAGDRLPRPLTARERRRIAGDDRFVHRRHAWLYVAPLGGGDTLLAATAPQRHGWIRLIGTILAITLAVALVSMPSTRALTRPLERLTRTARAFGEGDLTARAGFRRPDEVGELAAAFDDMADRVERLLTAERELLANVSHEIRTPLSRIRVALELANEESDAAAARGRLLSIREDIAELEALLENVLTATRMDLAGQGGRLPLAREAVHIEDVLADSIRRFSEVHGDRALRLDAADGLAPIEADRALLRRVVDNLLDNAAKYAPGDLPIEIVAAPVGDGVRVEVRDRGPGVDPEDLPRLFEPFFRAERSRNREGGGVGLGLSLCRRIVEAHGGRIFAEARDGGGTTFAFELPGGVT